MRQACYDCSASTSAPCWQHPTLYVRATEGLYEVEGAEVAERAGRVATASTLASASSCSHAIRDLLAICRHCQTALVIEDDWDGVR